MVTREWKDDLGFEVRCRKRSSGRETSGLLEQLRDLSEDAPPIPVRSWFEAKLSALITPEDIRSHKGFAGSIE